MSAVPGMKQARRLAHLLRHEGARALLARIRNRILSPAHAEYRRRKAHEDRAFDAPRGLDTGGVQHAARLACVDGPVGSATSHVAIPPADFHAAIAALDVPLDQATFVDLGSGKGRALLLAAALPFRRLIGVEFATPLHAIAVRNFAAVGMAVGPAERVELRNADAAAFAFPAGAIVLFLYHPFGPPVMRRVAEASLAAWRAGARPMQIAYVNPVHLDDWLALGWQLKVRARTHAILDPPPA